MATVPKKFTEWPKKGNYVLLSSSGVSGPLVLSPEILIGPSALGFRFGEKLCPGHASLYVSLYVNCVLTKSLKHATTTFVFLRRYASSATIVIQSLLIWVLRTGISTGQTK